MICVQIICSVAWNQRQSVTSMSFSGLKKQLNKANQVRHLIIIMQPLIVPTHFLKDDVIRILSITLFFNYGPFNY